MPLRYRAVRLLPQDVMELPPGAQALLDLHVYIAIRIHPQSADGIVIFPARVRLTLFEPSLGATAAGVPAPHALVDRHMPFREAKTRAVNEQIPAQTPKLAHEIFRVLSQTCCKCFIVDRPHRTPQSGCDGFCRPSRIEVPQPRELLFGPISARRTFHRRAHQAFSSRTRPSSVV